MKKKLKGNKFVGEADFLNVFKDEKTSIKEAVECAKRIVEENSLK